MTKAKYSFTVTAILDAANTIEAADKLRGLLESNGFEQTSCECGGVTLGPKTVRVITNAPVAATRTATAHAARKTATPTMCSRSDATRMTVTTRSTSAKTIGATIPNARKTPSDTPSNAKDGRKASMASKSDTSTVPNMPRIFGRNHDLRHRNQVACHRNQLGQPIPRNLHGGRALRTRHTVRRIRHGLPLPALRRMGGYVATSDTGKKHSELYVKIFHYKEWDAISHHELRKRLSKERRS